MENNIDIPIAEIKMPLIDLLESTPIDHIYCTSDWHMFKSHYKKEHNYVNVSKIVSWCKQNISSDDIFMYLGDLVYRYANKEDQQKAIEIYNSIPGIKILVLGNHDKDLGQDFFANSGFDYVVEDIDWISRQLLFTHRPLNMTSYPEGYLNIHGHIHNIETYNTTDGQLNINVYPYWYNNTCPTLQYLLNHKAKLVANHGQNWCSMIGEDVSYSKVFDNSFSRCSKLLEYVSNNYKPKVYFTSSITSSSIERLVNKFKNKLNGDVCIKSNVNESLIKGISKTYNAKEVNNVDECVNLDVTSECKYSESVSLTKGISCYDSMVSVSQFRPYESDGYIGSLSNISELIKNELDDAHHMEEICEGVYTISSYMNNNIIYVNVLESYSCDSDDIGILVSDNIVAVEMASINFIKASTKRRKLNRNLIGYLYNNGGMHQLETLQEVFNTSALYELYNADIDAVVVRESSKWKDVPKKDLGIPEDGKFPLDSEEHVRSAIKLFGHAEESKKASLAKRIRRAASKYNIDIPKDCQVAKYLNEAMSLNGSIIPPNIDTLIFDFGGVLVNYKNYDNPCYKAASSVIPNIDDEMYGLYFSDYDKLNITQARELYRKKNPKNYKIFDTLVKANVSSQALYPYTIELLQQLRDRGYKLYYLSNWSRFTYDSNKELFNKLLPLFDGGVFSFQTPWMKPDKRIYLNLLYRYDIDQSKALFIDDFEENIEAGRGIGLDGIVFTQDLVDKLMGGPVLLNTGNIIVYKDYATDTMVSDDIDNIGKFHIGVSQDDYKGKYYSFDKAIKLYASNIAIGSLNTGFVFMYNGKSKPICIAKIDISNDGQYQWDIQYSIAKKDGMFINDPPLVNEWAMNAMNPIVGITKPFILKTSMLGGGMDQYMFSPDIVNDKYLVIDENAKLKVVPSNKIDGNLCVEIYEYIGDKSNIDRAYARFEEAYRNKESVDNTFFYTTLTGKPLLESKQIDMDSDFRKVDLEAIQYKFISEVVTLRDGIYKCINKRAFGNFISEQAKGEMAPILNKYNKHGDLHVREDRDGYYIISTFSGKRTVSVSSTRLFTESMIKAIF